MKGKTRGALIQEGHVRGYLAKPDGAPAPVILVFMEIWGINDHIKHVCERLAENGLAAFALDFYDGALFPESDLNGAIGKIKSLSDQGIMESAGNAIRHLKQRSDVRGDSLGVLGFCNGGRLAFLTATNYPQDTQATICFYGGGIDNPEDRLGRSSVLGKVGALQAPLLLAYGAKDASITPAEHGRICQALSDANKRYTLTVFPDVGHAFMDKTGPAEALATKEAWSLVDAFWKEHLG